VAPRRRNSAAGQEDDAFLPEDGASVDGAQGGCGEVVEDGVVEDADEVGHEGYGAERGGDDGAIGQ
jgi:hypothetical protein